MEYRTKEGDVVDAICYKLYGHSDYTPQVYALNPGLAEYGPQLPAGLLLNFPMVAPTLNTIPKISLFD